VTRVVTVVLAAGRGERMGGPKALLLVHDEHGEEAPLAVVHARARLASESERVIVVVRAEVAHVLRPLLPAGAEVVISTRPDDEGPAGSIVTAASRLDGAEALLITPVDVRPARPETARALVAALASGTAIAARPRHGGRRGHPVALRSEALAPYRAPAAPPPLRDVLRALGERCVDVVLDDADAMADFDAPADLGGAARFYSSPSGLAVNGSKS
jgi:CTP:molybdopterin cytidylyltransferase MocA